MLLDPRLRLAARQAALVQALAGQGPPPANVDPERLAACAKSLAVKRRRAVARTWPELTRALAAQFAELFAVYAQQVPLPGDGSPLADGRWFAKWLAAQGNLPDAGRLEMLAVDLRYVQTAAGLRPRRGPIVRLLRLPQSKRWLLAWRLPWFAPQCISVSLDRFFHDRRKRHDGTAD